MKFWKIVNVLALGAFGVASYRILGVSKEMTLIFALIFTVCFVFLGWAMGDKRGGRMKDGGNEQK